ncbi:homeobox even-skipped homolog protein 2-like [Rhinopithecus roxellana]|uniref:homeobox even-skipped homolog protein 2-like n=1 Tax=Rhinopithecus roxellana TaxID=61622 RepID=UPI0012379597|nr:homeobox even-skipped homolog protein 2-like [Rhinopithecus roxellana]
MAGAGACGAQRLRGGLSKRLRDWLRDGSGPCSNSSADHSPAEAAAQEAAAAQQGHVAGSGTSSGGGDQRELGPGPAGGARGGEGSCGAAVPPPPHWASYLPKAEPLASLGSHQPALLSRAGVPRPLAGRRERERRRRPVAKAPARRRG